MKKLIKRIYSGKRYKNGEAYIDTIVKIIICVVVGALLLMSIYAVASSALNNTTNKINNLFNINDAGDDNIGGEGETSELEESINPSPQLTAPIIEVDGTNLIIMDNDNNTANFDIYVDGVCIANMVKTTDVGDSSSVGNLLGTKWTFVKCTYGNFGDLDWSEEGNYNVSFISNNESFNFISIIIWLDEGAEMNFNTYRVYNPEGGTSCLCLWNTNYNNYKTVYFDGGSDVKNSHLISAIKRNAELISVPTSIDLLSLGLTDESHEISVKAKSNGYIDSEFSNCKIIN